MNWSTAYVINGLTDYIGPQPTVAYGLTDYIGPQPSVAYGLTNYTHLYQNMHSAITSCWNSKYLLVIYLLVAGCYYCKSLPIHLLAFSLFINIYRSSFFIFLYCNCLQFLCLYVCNIALKWLFQNPVLLAYCVICWRISCSIQFGSVRFGSVRFSSFQFIQFSSVQISSAIYLFFTVSLIGFNWSNHVLKHPTRGQQRHPSGGGGIHNTLCKNSAYFVVFSCMTFTKKKQSFSETVFISGKPKLTYF